MTRLALGPNLYFWNRDEVFDFYRQAASWPVDVIYLGEAVCSKRRALRLEDWLQIAEELTAAGKEVVLSTLALVEAESELLTMHRIAENGNFLIEANDMAAVQALAGKVPFVAGPHLNLYNGDSLRLMHDMGAKRWVMPVELSRETLKALMAGLPEGMETEVFAFGKLPLAFSARCFTARAVGLPKDDCQLRCGDYHDGMMVKSQDQKPFLVFNGIQTQSAATSSLLSAVPEMVEMGVELIRLSPQFKGMDQIVESFATAIQNGAVPDNGDEMVSQVTYEAGLCNGFWYGEAGMDWTPQSPGLD